MGRNGIELWKFDSSYQFSNKGLFEIVSEEEAASLESQGYTKVNWGIDLVDNRDEYDKYLFWDYDYVSAPIYLWPFTPNVMAAGGFTNGYGFKQE